MELFRDFFPANCFKKVDAHLSIAHFEQKSLQRTLQSLITEFYNRFYC